MNLYMLEKLQSYFYACVFTILSSNIYYTILLNLLNIFIKFNRVNMDLNVIAFRTVGFLGLKFVRINRFRRERECNVSQADLHAASVRSHKIRHHFILIFR